MFVNVFADGIVGYFNENTATFLAHADQTKTYFQMVLDVTNDPNEAMSGTVEKLWFYDDLQWSEENFTGKTPYEIRQVIYREIG
ncbi:MAG: hypothetical protein M1493_02720 [Firmicutes bacterium]|jgi:hypothetical protein|uniref:Uncharacterized protein n=1 Tax=Sulfobacillus benefaciens TaxID=453960 RepID=A0A2T2WG63_9FIRM|nr:hypothetical protein [Bacillota bacterium]PSR21231.1 MAG: hypothetical protein C7B43_21420 [Sulfobacillus benefaciens]